MLINSQSLAALTQAVNAMFARGLERAKPNWNKVAMEIPSVTGENIYPYLKKLGNIRKWTGDRVVQNLAKGEFRIVNDDYEETHAIPRNAVQDDQYGLYGALFEQTGNNVATFADKSVYGLLAAAFTTTGPDGQYLIDNDHPVGKPGQEVSVSNHMGGAGSAWFIVDSSKVFKPIIFQPRKAFNLQQFFDEKDPRVFWNKEFVWGVDGRAGVGFSPFWQLIVGSKQTLDVTNVQAALQAMASFKDDDGEPLDLMGTTLVVGASQAEVARSLINRELINSGESNPLFRRLEVVVSGRLG